MLRSMPVAVLGGLLGLFVAVSSGCPGTSDTDTDAGTGNDSGPADTDAGADAGTDAGMDACVPLTCETAGLTCGSTADGCGGTLECGTCLCTATTFLTDCPSRPCEVATGCVNNACAYEPVTCNFEQCATCAGGACMDTDLRGCGTGCANDYCDPNPSMVNGKTVYGNQCVARTALRCGVCALGTLECAGGASLPASCQSIEIAGVNPEFLECDGSSPSATILYVDPTFTGATHDGGRNSPFLTLNDALIAAAQRSSRAIIIGGSPTFTQALAMTEGLSIYGGFTGAPTWLPDPTRRPIFEVPLSALQGGKLIGLSAVNIAVTTTELANVDIVTPSITGTNGAAGASNAGAQLVNAGKLVLRDVHFTVGGAQDGALGANASAPTGTVPVGGNGGPSKESIGNNCFSLTPSVAGITTAPTCNSAPAPLGLGGTGASSPVPTSTADSGFTQGNASPTGAQGGLASWNNNTFTAGPGQDGALWTVAAATGATGVASVQWANDFPNAQGQGAAGTPGSPGRGGGGGGSGAHGEFYNSSNQTVCRVGGGGGGGGAGGCGGLGGSGGYPGGWTYGLVLSGSAGVTLTNVTFTVGTPGTGGAGGGGSGGTPGANGGNGGPNTIGFPTYIGSNGGKGGPGQAGGVGGDGASGQSVGVICAGATTMDLSKVTFTSSGGSFQNTQGCN